jgi:hypothetical protein
MNEKQLKSLFCKALASGHISNNDILPSSKDARLRIVEEANFRSFDLLIAAITNESITRAVYTDSNGILMRTQLLEHFARTEKCRIDCIRFFPVEIKSDDDNIDERLPNQIINAILTFGISVLVLDKNHGKRIKKSSALKFLPATVACYTGVGDCFEIISAFDRFISNGIFSFNKSVLAKALSRDRAGNRAYNRLVLIQRILQKLAFNQIYYENLGLTEEELEFMEIIAELRMPTDNSTKRLVSLIKETANSKLTDFM